MHPQALIRRMLLYMYIVYVVPSKHPWVLVIYGPKLGGGAHTEKPYEHTQEPQSLNHRIIKNEGWALTTQRHLLRTIRYLRTCV